MKSLVRRAYLALDGLLHSPRSRHSNLEYNRRLWDLYARDWSTDSANVENRAVRADERETYLRYLGDEWGRVGDVEAILDQYVHPYIGPNSVVAEIGVGGGRIASRLAEKTGELVCFDVSSRMIKIARKALGEHRNVRFVLLTTPGLPSDLSGAFDFLYSFDVFVHLDLHMMWRYFRDIHRVLRAGGKAFIHTTNLTAPKGWSRFAQQDHFDVRGHYFVTPEVVKTLLDHADLSIVKESVVDEGNFYLARDYLIVVERA
jgi:SAM-dependent methyltransferase